MNAQERKFIQELETVSAPLAIWAQTMIAQNYWTITQVKEHLRTVMTKIEKAD